eukprot:CAMPEP_0181140366 /NCGR_PEP_ID=MMETSP1071-20121207/35267_1 /TAXON_ID=35127 /ORGANISM="Thalassiosira sp., Strain NH16" /LENGTH=304 /DNA_ID=CAMNT_0023227315 /DNA_START=227 /DNA_END=1138 /DNA_ORIENTATION=+
MGVDDTAALLAVELKRQQRPKHVPPPTPMGTALGTWMGKIRRINPSTTSYTSLRRGLTKLFAFAGILTYGVYIVSSQRQLAKILDAAFDVVGPRSADDAPVYDGFRLGTPYHRRIRTMKRSAYHNNDNNITISPNVRISFELHDPKTVPLTNVYNLYVTCPIGKVMLGKVGSSRRHATGEFRTGELPPSLSRVRDERTLDGTLRSGRVLDFTTTIRTDLKLLLIGDSVMVQLAQSFEEIVGGVEMGSRRVIWNAWRGHDGGTADTPPPKTYAYPIVDDGHHGIGKGNSTIGNFDVIVFRVMHGW